MIPGHENLLTERNLNMSRSVSKGIGWGFSQVLQSMEHKDKKNNDVGDNYVQWRECTSDTNNYARKKYCLLALAFTVVN